MSEQEGVSFDEWLKDWKDNHPRDKELKRLKSRRESAMNRSSEYSQRIESGTETDNKPALEAARDSYLKEAQILDGHIEVEEKKIASFIKEESPEQLYKRLMKHPMVRSITIDNNDYLVIQTECILNHRHRMGRYEIGFPVDLEDPEDVYIQNLDYEIEYPHPHVSSEGKPCTGDFYTGLFKYIEAGDIYLLIDGYIQYLALADNQESQYYETPDWLDERELREDSEESKSKNKTKEASVDDWSSYD